MDEVGLRTSYMEALNYLVRRERVPLRPFWKGFVLALYNAQARPEFMTLNDAAMGLARLDARGDRR